MRPLKIEALPALGVPVMFSDMVPATAKFPIFEPPGSLLACDNTGKFEDKPAIFVWRGLAGGERWFAHTKYRELFERLAQD